MKTQIIKINTGNFNYNNILFSQNFWHFSFVKEKQNQYEKFERKSQIGLWYLQHKWLVLKIHIPVT